MCWHINYAPNRLVLAGYSIEGWLTTAPGAAKFAATVPAPPTLISAAP